MSQDDSEDRALTEAEIAEAEAAVALAYADDEPLPAALRAKVEADAKAILGQRAKDHARARVAAAGPSQAIPASTTAAGAQVVELPSADERRVRAGATARTNATRTAVTYGGWMVAAAAAALLVIRASPDAGSGVSGSGVSGSGVSGSGQSSGGPAPRAVPPPTSIEQRVAVTTTGGEVSVRFDRAFGVGLVKVTRPDGGEAATLQVWLAFEGDPVAKPVALLPPEKTSMTFGGVCPPEPTAAARCAAVNGAIVTRESARGAFALPADPSAVLGRGVPEPSP